MQENNSCIFVVYYITHSILKVFKIKVFNKFLVLCWKVGFIVLFAWFTTGGAMLCPATYKKLKCFYYCSLPQSLQNFESLSISTPQCLQNFVSFNPFFTAFIVFVIASLEISADVFAMSVNSSLFNCCT